jgi:Skp family chaperone for outer membrane proteins
MSLNKEMKVYNDERKKIYRQFEEIKKKRLNDFLEKITPIIEIFVKENSINLVLNEKNLFIASKKFDITNDIIQIVNKKIK